MLKEISKEKAVLMLFNEDEADRVYFKRYSRNKYLRVIDYGVKINPFKYKDDEFNIAYMDFYEERSV